MTEVWREIAGLEGRYEVSDAGRVRSMRRRNRMVDRARPVPHVLAPFFRRGYALVDIGGRPRSIHRLVLETFVGLCPAGHQGSHLNGDRADNRVSNLCWETPQRNLARRVDHGTLATGDRAGARVHPERVARGRQHGAYTKPGSVRRGELHGCAKLTVEQVVAIRRAAATGESGAALARRYGMAGSTIRSIVRRENWTHVDEELDCG